LGSQAARVQQESARLRAHSAELITRLADLQQAIAGKLDELAQQRGDRRPQAGQP
jgi:hypothetical protein